MTATLSDRPLFSMLFKWRSIVCHKTSDNVLFVLIMCDLSIFFNDTWLASRASFVWSVPHFDVESTRRKCLFGGTRVWESMEGVRRCNSNCSASTRSFLIRQSGMVTVEVTRAGGLPGCGPLSLSLLFITYQSPHNSQLLLPLDTCLYFWSDQSIK